MEINLLISLYLFLIGICLGSFINMLVYRVHIKQGLGGRSYCDHTKEELTGLDLIPIFSYLISGGKCRHCGEKLPLLYPVVEFSCGVLAIVTFFSLNLKEFNLISAIELIAALIFVFSLVFFAVYDYLYWEVDLRSIIVMLIFGLLINLLNIFLPIPYLQAWWSNLAAALLLGTVMLIIFVIAKGRSGMGYGDVLLFMYCGLFLGLNLSIWFFILMSVSGSLVGAVKWLRVKTLKDTKVQLAPFIGFAAITVFLFQTQILHWLNLILGLS